MNKRVAHKAITEGVANVLTTCHFDIFCDLLLQTDAWATWNLLNLCSDDVDAIICIFLSSKYRSCM